MIFSVNTISAKLFLASCPLKINAFAVSYLAQFLRPIFLPYGYVIKKVHNMLLYDAGQFYVKSNL